MRAARPAPLQSRRIFTRTGNKVCDRVLWLLANVCTAAVTALADCNAAQQREVDNVLQDLKGLLGGRREGRWPADRAARLYERTQELVQLVERLPEAVASACSVCNALYMVSRVYHRP